MKTFVLRVLVGFILVTPSLVGHANTPGYAEQLRQLTAQLQQSPNDQALREKIIALALRLDPRPATPDAATIDEGAAESAFKNAKAKSDYSHAAKQYEKALLLAPWLAADYFNCGVAHEKAGENKEAIRSFNLYLLAAPNAHNALAVKKRIGGLQYAARKAVDEANIRKAQWEKLYKSLDGGVWRGDIHQLPTADGMAHSRGYLKIHDGALFKMGTDWSAGQTEPNPPPGKGFEPVELTGRRVTYRMLDPHPGCTPVTVEISDNGNSITQTYHCDNRKITATYVRIK